jgi:hypothetical protein
LDQNTKKKQAKFTKKKGGQTKTHSIKDDLSKLQDISSSKGKSMHPSYPKAERKPKESFKEKYGKLFSPALEHFPAKKSGDEKAFTLPTKVEQPEESRIVLMDIDPHRLHAYWEISHKDKTRILEQLGESSHLQKKIIRVYDVTYIHFDGNNAHGYFDIETDKDRGNWYISLWSPHKSLCAEIGMKSSQGNFYPLARSNVIVTPKAYQSSSGEEQWMKVSGDYEEISMLSAKPQPEKIEHEGIFPQKEKELQEPDLKKAHLPLTKQKIPLKSNPSIGKELPLEVTIVDKNRTPTTSQSHKEKIPSEKKVIKIQEKGSYEKNKSLFTESKATKESTKPYPFENKIKDYYKRLYFINKHQEKRPQPPSANNPQYESVIPSEEGLKQMLFTERYTHYGSDIRWEEEVTRLADSGKEKIIIPEVIKKKPISK